jgi:hypothetical protein
LHFLSYSLDRWDERNGLTFFPQAALGKRWAEVQ